MMKENSPRKTYDCGPGNATPNACLFENKEMFLLKIMLTLYSFMTKFYWAANLY